MRPRYARTLVGALLLAAPSVPVLAATCTWLGGTTSWGTPTAWSCSAVPGASDDVVIASGTVTMDTGSRITVHALTFTGGVLTGPDSLRITGPLLWESGGMSGTGATLVSGAATFRTAVAKTIGREVILAGGAVWSDGTLQMADGGLLRNRALFLDNAAGTHSIARIGAITTAPLVQNQGRWQITSAGTNTNVDFVNEGALVLAGGGFDVNAPAHFTHAPAASLSGGSLLDLASGAIATMGGRVEPGGPNVIGLFSVRGPYTMGPQHVLDVDLAASVPSSDLLQTSDGDVSIDGRLVLRLASLSLLGQSVTVLTHGGSGRVTGCYTADDIDVFGPDGLPAAYPVRVTCTASAIEVQVLGSTAAETPLPAADALALAVESATPARRGDLVALRFTLPAAAETRLDAFDVLGRHVAPLVEGPTGAGTQRVLFSTTGLTPGVYVVRLQTRTRTASLRLTVAE